LIPDALAAALLDAPSRYAESKLADLDRQLSEMVQSER
jgi:hypothetical protein